MKGKSETREGNVELSVLPEDVAAPVDDGARITSSLTPVGFCLKWQQLRGFYCPRGRL